jgi:cytoskeleton protein RodZ
VLQDRKHSLARERAMMVSHAEKPAPAARVGADLRTARERLGWSLPAIAAHLRIREPYLAALEDGRIDDLPGIAYAVGFLRSYAAVLGLDPAEIIRRFRAEAAAATRRPELNFPAPVPDRGVPAGAVVLLGAVLAVGAYIGWYRASEHAAPRSDAVPAVPERLAALAERDAPLPAPAPPPAPAAPAATAAEDSEPAPPPLPSFSPSSAAAAVVMPPVALPAPASTAPAPPPAVPVAAAPALPPTVPDATAAPAHIVVRATADAWVQVRDKGGQILLNRVLRGGESWAVPDRPALLLTTGNAGGTELLVDGTATASLGTDGAVRRDLPLDAEAILSGRLAPHAAQH